MLDQVLAFLEGDMARRGVAMERETDESLFVHGDKDLLYRAFYNILVNGQQMCIRDRRWWTGFRGSCGQGQTRLSFCREKWRHFQAR